MNNGTANITGDVNLLGSGSSITVQGTGSSLVIDGNLSLGSSSSIMVNSSLTVTGNVDGSSDSSITNNGSATTTIYGTLTGFSSISGTLPIDLVYFRVNLSQNSVSLKWQTATEENNDYFTLERSKDGVNYEIIATIKGAGYSYTPLNYSYTDANPLQGVSYYRLTQTDYDGAFETFSPVSVAFINEGELQIGPNPAKSFINVGIGGEMGSGKISIYNLTGAVVKSMNMNSNYQTINIDDLPAGNYMMIISAGNEIISRKIIKE